MYTRILETLISGNGRRPKHQWTKWTWHLKKFKEERKLRNVLNYTVVIFKR